MTRRNPVRGQIYTVKEIVNDLKLRDSPFLCSEITNPIGEKVKVVIQTSWCGDDELIPIMGDTRYKYIRETSEWIPIFEFVGTEEEFLKTVDCAVTLDQFLKQEEPVGMTVWPKGTEYIQYYKVNEDNTMIDTSYGLYPTTHKLKRALDIEKSRKA